VSLTSQCCRYAEGDAYDGRCAAAERRMQGEAVSYEMRPFSQAQYGGAATVRERHRP